MGRFFCLGWLQEERVEAGSICNSHFYLLKTKTKNTLKSMKEQEIKQPNIIQTRTNHELKQKGIKAHEAKSKTITTNKGKLKLIQNRENTDET